MSQGNTNSPTVVVEKDVSMSTRDDVTLYFVRRGRSIRLSTRPEMVMTALHGPQACPGLMAMWEQWANPILVSSSTLPLKNAHLIFAR